MLTALLLAGVTVTLPQTAEVPGTSVRLGAIAQLSGSPDQVALLADLELGYAPAPGYTRLFDRRSIEASLARRLPGVDLTFAGAASCRVAPRTEEIDGATLTAVARGELDRLFAGQEVELSLERGAPDLIVPQGEAGTLLQPVLEGRTLRGGTWTVPVQVLVDGTVYQTAWTHWEVAYWETRTVLARPVRRGQVLSPDFFEERRVRVQGTSLAAPLSPELFGTAIAVRDLPEGAVVTQQDVERPQVVQRGDRLVLEVRRGAIVARTPVIAATSARVGDRITVTTVESGHELRAFILSSELASFRLD